MKLSGKVVLIVVGLVVAVICFGLGFGAAVFMAGADPSTAIQAATAFGRNSLLVREYSNTARFTARRIVQSPAYATQRLANEGAAGLTAQLPDFLSSNPQVMALASSSGQASQSRVDNYNRALDKFERENVASLTPPVSTLSTSASTSGTGAQGEGDSAADAAAAPLAEAPELTRRTQPAPGTEEQATPYAVELGSFLSGDNAEAFAASLQKEGHEVFVVEQPDHWGRLWLHVRIGPYPTYAAAAKKGKVFASRGFSGLVIEEISKETKTND
ncbi:MAG: hypothetical protein VR70_00705 [Rhodospirillaceae bacterium BRH_c57]|nr:MAG: hypothetical protein VR70_00705 [Rhodospirillaceae bacterium BRH_c57]